MKRVSGFLILIFICAALCACAPKSAAVNGERIIAVSIVPEQTFVQAVCGDLAKVVVMVPPGSSPETYEPTPQEMALFSKADIFFAIGVPAEENNLFPNMDEHTKLVRLENEAAAVYPELSLGSERDPHIWLSPKRVIIMIESIAREMSALDPENAAVYQENAKDYIDELETVDQQLRDSLSGVKNRKFVVFHPAFGYLADDYGLEMFALEEEGKEATITHLQEMIDLAKKENIRAIFYQAETDSRQAEAFAEELDGKTVELAPLAADYIENLSRMAALMAEVMQ